MRDVRLAIAAAAVAGAMTVSAAFLLGGQATADASVLSRGSQGWLAARRYLEARGCRVMLLDHGLDAPVGAVVLVLAFPFQQLLCYDDLPGGAECHLCPGGDMLCPSRADRVAPAPWAH